jgi:hypothetical protein
MSARVYEAVPRRGGDGIVQLIAAIVWNLKGKQRNAPGVRALRRRAGAGGDLRTLRPRSSVSVARGLGGLTLACGMMGRS